LPSLGDEDNTAKITRDLKVGEKNEVFDNQSTVNRVKGRVIWLCLFLCPKLVSTAIYMQSQKPVQKL